MAAGDEDAAPALSRCEMVTGGDCDGLSSAAPSDHDGNSSHQSPIPPPPPPFPHSSADERTLLAQLTCMRSSAALVNGEGPLDSLL
uniref:Uncharacterized protein n=1 Tax=Oryza sativa subsp. japonica TaxID=39947 RepID=Q84S71_ORYSJ|nr:hypothetical protein [Oryza sativa Japonica Group]